MRQIFTVHGDAKIKRDSSSFSGVLKRKVKAASSIKEVTKANRFRGERVPILPTRMRFSKQGICPKSRGKWDVKVQISDRVTISYRKSISGEGEKGVKTITLYDRAKATNRSHLCHNEVQLRIHRGEPLVCMETLDSGM